MLLLMSCVEVFSLNSKFVPECRASQQSQARCKQHTDPFGLNCTAGTNLPDSDKFPEATA